MLILMMGATFAATITAHRYERQAASRQSERVATGAASLLRSELETAATSLNDEAAFFAGSTKVTPQEFAVYGEQILGRASLTRIGWIERVPAARRSAFEARVGAPVVEPVAGTDRYRRAPERATYFPIARIAADGGRVPPLGTDVGAEPRRRAALQRAIAEGRMSTSGMVRLLGTGERGVVAYRPAYRAGSSPRTPDQRRAALVGVASGSFSVEGLLMSVLSGVGPVAVTLGGEVLHPLEPGARAGVERSVMFGDGVFRVTAPEQATSLALPAATLAGGLSVTVLVGLLIFVLARRDRRQVEAIAAATRALSETRERERRLLDNAPDVIARYDRDLRCVFVNPAIERATGRPADQFIGRRVDRMDGPSHVASTWADGLGRVFRTGQPDEIRFEFPLADGPRFFSSRLTPERDESGDVVSVLAITRDVTERVVAQAALAASEDRYRSLVAAMGDGVVVQGDDGAIVDCNPAAERILGLTRDQMLGRASIDPRWRSIREDGSPWEGADHPAMQTLRSGIALRDQLMGIRRPDGSLAWISISTEPMLRDGAPSVVTSFADVTVVVTAEREQAALQRLATLVASDPDPRRVFGALAYEAATLLDSAAAGVMCFDEGTELAHLVGAWLREPLVEPPFGAPFHLDPGTAAGIVARTGRRAVVGDGSEGPIHPNLIMPGVGVSAAIAAPVTVDGRLWGALAVVTRAENGFDVDAAERLERLCGLASLAISSSDARTQLATLASTDHLTGLANRRVFEEQLTAEIERARHHRWPLSLVVMDIDHFKSVNDTHGHPAGDRVLVEFARRLGAIVRGGDIPARIGGEEFAWILPATDGAEALAAAERLRRAVAADPFAGVGALTASLGVCDLEHASGGPELLRLADLALYRAKTQGRNRVCRHAPASEQLLAVGQSPTSSRTRSSASLHDRCEADGVSTSGTC